MVSQVVSVLTFAGVWGGEREPSADLTSATGSGRQPTVYRLKEMRGSFSGRFGQEKSSLLGHCDLR